ncbi:MAG: NAD-dependent deacylase [Balneolaceae bacterium]|nr:NAD-dependent deacylase [Balneolaceae bacterium]MBO6547012.1 NAD-dependent deacylase [Balneolaceae bacterium]MBO6649372.1 NAD-dependent deacylase [Balneolaceae bacterium]
MPNRKLVVLTGSGISAESGLATFRDSGGLWEGFNVHEVATIEGWHKDRSKVLEFYNLRRKQASKAEPNKGHFAIRELEDFFEVVLITQNVDDLHEKAGSSNIIHLHGELTKARSEDNPYEVIEIGYQEIKLGDKSADGSQLRPAIVWFGEMVPMIEKAALEVMEAEILLVVGTSLAVYPAAGLVNYAKQGIPKYIVDPSNPELFSYEGWTHIKKTATKGLPEIVEILKNQIN